ncbi:hypothetical protein HanXRQr2_Chr01g0038731 [Helianthus annuus]|uniref:Uncharacterized protein n=1 Tax=Helianthus annuus TaxID=4232 RepID=A0A9K3P493_HELAN|nr:hypothetical protein HanXRQr2_Chr01g0038731 [Helianthus annuus]
MKLDIYLIRIRFTRDNEITPTGFELISISLSDSIPRSDPPDQTLAKNKSSSAPSDDAYVQMQSAPQTRPFAPQTRPFASSRLGSARRACGLHPLLNPFNTMEAHKG